MLLENEQAAGSSSLQCMKNQISDCFGFESSVSDCSNDCVSIISGANSACDEEIPSVKVENNIELDVLTDSDVYMEYENQKSSIKFKLLMKMKILWMLCMYLFIRR